MARFSAKLKRATLCINWLGLYLPVKESDGKNFLLFFCEGFVDLLDVFVVELLHGGFTIFLHVFGHAVVFHLFLKTVKRIATGVAD